MLSVEDRKKIKAELPFGSMTIIANEAGVSQQSVSAWISGRHRSSERIEMAALDYLRRYKKMIKKAKAGNI